MDPNLNNLEFGEYGFGTKRSLAEYERYGGIRFRDRTVQRTKTLPVRWALKPRSASKGWCDLIDGVITYD